MPPATPFFIPPASITPDPPHPPVIPQLQSDNSASSSGPQGLPTTQSTPWSANAYPPPQGGYGPAQQPGYYAPPGFQTPYPTGPPVIPMAGATPYPAYQSPNLPGFIPPNTWGFTPAAPATQPLHPSMYGFSQDWIGTPGITPNTAPVVQAAQQHAQAAARAHGGYGGYTPFNGPTSAPVVPTMGGWGPQAPAGGGGWGAQGFPTPGPPGFATPYTVGGGGAWPGAAPAAAGGWGAAGPTPGWGPMDPLTQGMAAMGLAGAPPPRSRRSAPVDRIGRFVAGKHYHPVLTPMLIKVVGAKLQLNPVLTSRATEPTEEFLEWNVAHPSSTVHYSKDPEHKSWSAGRGDPATFPRTTHVRIITNLPTYPWIVEVEAGDPEIGVTCAEILDTIFRDLRTATGANDWKSRTSHEQGVLRQAYTFNRSRHRSAPGGTLDQGMKRVDYLGDNVVWGGLEVVDAEGEHQSLMRNWLNQGHGSVPIDMPCVLLLNLDVDTDRQDQDGYWTQGTRSRRPSEAAAPARASSRPRSGSTHTPSRPRSGQSHAGSARPGSRQGRDEEGWGGGLAASSRARSRSRARSVRNPSPPTTSSSSDIGIRVRGVDSDESDDGSSSD